VPNIAAIKEIDVWLKNVRYTAGMRGARVPLVGANRRRTVLVGNGFDTVPLDLAASANKVAPDSFLFANQ
jgi:hypothetical protein